MFKKAAKQGGEIISDEVETIIGPSVQIKGEFTSNGNIMIAGVVNGKISTAHNLRIEENAKIQADIQAQNAIIAGEVRGAIHISGHLEIISTAKIHGDIQTGSIAIQQGAYINGNCSMNNANEQEKINAENTPGSTEDLTGEFNDFNTSTQENKKQ
jgi:cytoskeletal protein CcmA (bactofilin family)